MSDVVKAFGILLYRVLESPKGTGSKIPGISNIEFLFLKASYANKHWTPPKGLMEINEEGLETAQRETFEETGISKEQYKLRNFQRTLKYLVRGKPKETTYFLANLINNSDEVILSKEHTEYKWVNTRDLDTCDFEHSLKTLIIEAEQYIKSEEKSNEQK